MSEYNDADDDDDGDDNVVQDCMVTIGLRKPYLM